jgi:hypothetical protein
MREYIFAANKCLDYFLGLINERGLRAEETAGARTVIDIFRKDNLIMNIYLRAKGNHHVIEADSTLSREDQDLMETASSQGFFTY